MATTKGGAHQSAQNQAKDANQKRLKVKISSPYQTYFQGDAVSVTAANKKGPFDILAGHINFFSLLTTSQIVVDTGFQRLQFPLQRGIIRVERDVVTIFADI